MSDKKITQLNNITGANLVDADEFVVVDISADETKAITLGELKEAFDAGSGFVRVTGDTMTGALDVQSTITSDGLTVDGGGVLSIGTNNAATASDISLSGNAVIGATTSLNAVTGSGGFSVRVNATDPSAGYSDGIPAILIGGGSTNDISFYEDTGTTPKFFWDASAESLGIGTTTAPSSNDVKQVISSANGAFTQYSYNGGAGGVVGSAATGYLDFFTYTGNIGSETYSRRMTIDSSGNVGIGTSSPSGAKLHISDNAAVAGVKISNTGTSGRSYLMQTTSAAAGIGGGYFVITDDGAGADRLVIDSSGNVGIGTSSPSYPLDVEDSGGGFVKASFVSTGSSHSSVVFDNTGSSANSVRVGSNNNDFYVRTSGTERMRIDSSGNVQLTTANDTAGTFKRLIFGTNSFNRAEIRVTNAATYDGSLEFYTGNASNYQERMRIDSSGNVGIGTSSPSYGLHVKNTVDAQAAGQFERTGGAIMRIQPEGFDAKFGTYSNTPLEFMTNSTERMRIDSSGNVGIGNSNPDLPLTVTAAGNANALSLRARSQDDYAFLQFYNHAGNTLRGQIWNHNGSIAFSTDSDGTERMRITSDGDLVNTGSTLPSASVQGFGVQGQTIMTGVLTTATRNHHIFYNGNGTVGTITTSGSATSYNTSSDYRLKTDAQPMTGASARVQALNPVNFEWIADGTRVDGFLAHEAQAVVPEAVHGTKDAMKDEEYEVTPAVLDEDGNETTAAVMGTRSVPDYQGIDQSKLVPLLTAALQEALTKIDDLETRLTALEG